MNAQISFREIFPGLNIIDIHHGQDPAALGDEQRPTPSSTAASSGAIILAAALGNEPLWANPSSTAQRIINHNKIPPLYQTAINPCVAIEDGILENGKP